MALLNSSVLGKTLYTVNTVQYISYAVDKNRSQYKVIGSDIDSRNMLKSHKAHSL